MPNEQLQKSFPSTANGTDELSKLPGYSHYWYSDRFSMYNAYSLEPGPSRELLAIHTPLGLLEPSHVQPPPLSSAPCPTMLTFGRPHMLMTTPKARTLLQTSSKDTQTSLPYVSKKIGR